MFTLNCKGRLLVVDKPVVMGIMNITPDSFYEGSRFNDEDSILRRVEKMIADGLDILDIGGQSTRPHSERIDEEEELKRVIAPIHAIKKNFPDSIISIDTFYAKVALGAVEAGASIVNDISGGNNDPNMLSTVGKLSVPYVCMHMKGTPATMHEFASYENIARELLDFFILKKEQCRKAGIHDVIIDPGFGFAKTIAHNFELLKKLSVLKMLNCPIMAGLSRKSTIYKTLGTDAAGALNGSTVLHTIALLNGASILRVHDVKEAKEAIKLVSEYNRL